MLLTLTGAWAAYSKARWSQGTTVGAYWIPSLTGWHKRVEMQPAKRYKGSSRNGEPYDFTMPSAQQVIFDTNIDGSKLEVSFEGTFWTHSLQPNDIFRGRAAAEVVLFLCAQSHHKPREILEHGPTQFHNRPAFLMHTTGPNLTSDGLEDSKTLDFIDENVEYTISARISGGTLSNQGQDRLHQVWNMLTRQITHV